MKYHTLTFAIIASSLGCASKDVRPTNTDPQPPAAQQTQAASPALIDLRPEPFRRVPTALETSSGQTLLQEMLDAHGGLVQFESKGTLKLTVLDDWSAAPDAMAGAVPWPARKQSFVMTQKANKLDASIYLTDGELQGLRYTVDGTDFSESKDGAAPTKTDGRYAFSIKALGFFAQAPFQLAFADTVFELPAVEHGGVNYRRLFASWGKAEPQEGVDQYVAWIHPDTRALAFLQFTVRDAGPMVASGNQYRDLKNVDGIWFPQKMSIVPALDAPTILHDMYLTDIEFVSEDAASQPAR